MGLLGVPWMVNGAEHSAVVGRILAYAAMGQAEGVVGPEDFKVVASAIPDGNIHVQPGAAGLLNRYPGGASQGYIVASDGDEVRAMTAQGSSGDRWDLVALIVQDPDYPGQPDPVDVEDGPYVDIVIYEDVPETTLFLSEIVPDQTGYALALVKFSALDGTVTNTEITDLRDLLMPRQHTEKRTLNGVAAANLAGALAVAPTGASWPIYVPPWAKKAIIEARWSGLQHLDTGAGNGNSAGGATVNIGAAVSSQTSWSEDATAANKPVTSTVLVAEEVDVSALAGTVQNLQAKLSKTSGAGMTSRWTSATTVVAEVTFKEALI